MAPLRMLWGTAVELLTGAASASHSQTQASTLLMRSDINKIANLFSLYFHKVYEMASRFILAVLARYKNNNIPSQKSIKHRKNSDQVGRNV